MFNRVLIANRGEIACRIAETARKIGLTTVGIFSEADINSKHVSLCDDVFLIEGSSPLGCYLDQDKIIEIAVKSKAGAIHPGYGFLSENSKFAQKVEEAGLVFVGPDHKAIKIMGQKDEAKKCMAKANVPIIPGYLGRDQTTKRLEEEAKSIGYPVLIKAVAGGGGKGMRLVKSSKDFKKALKSAQSEAEKAFNNNKVILEKYISSPRHIEIQIFGDGKTAIHLFERDCSLQRRHQKVLEECPAPGMTSSMREAMCEAAVTAAKAIGYKGAGTVEFIVDGSNGLQEDKFWFMEMNTRLQVEHPITEEITGIDLVAWQFEIAMGKSLTKDQSDLSIDGHAFEARIYAENPNNNFLPEVGKIKHLRFPSDIRVESGIKVGDIISPYFDPMLAKIIAHGKDRKSALGKLDKALRQIEILGVKTNLDFLCKLSQDPSVKRGLVRTDLIEEKLEDLIFHKPISTEAIIAASMCYFSPQPDHFSYSHWVDIFYNFQLSHNGTIFEINFSQPESGKVKVLIMNESYDVLFKKQQWLFREKKLPEVKIFGEEIIVFDDTQIPFKIRNAFEVQKENNADNNEILSPMPGMISKINIKNGSQVFKGQPIMALEAMKMEYEVVAPNDGTIKKVNFSVGNFVQQGEKLCDFALLT